MSLAMLWCCSATRRALPLWRCGFCLGGRSVVCAHTCPGPGWHERRVRSHAPMAWRGWQERRVRSHAPLA
eukprot:6237033-Prorocentrum_lima.AAC.1